MLQNSNATRKLNRKPAPISRLDAPVTIRLDKDLMPSLLDMFGASGSDSWEDWLSSFITDALRPQLGL
jgi:hypothetical protein